MRSRFQFYSVLIAWVFMGLSLFATAEEPTASSVVATETANTPQVDRDGKRICGWNLMSESERGGYKNIMHQTKALADRDDIRADHCARMRVRAKERSVATEE